MSEVQKGIIITAVSFCSYLFTQLCIYDWHFWCI